MSGDIDDFLKQAAKRRQQRQQQQQRPASSPARPQSQSNSPTPTIAQPLSSQQEPIQRAPMPSISSSSDLSDSIPTAEVIEPIRSIGTPVSGLRSSIPSSGLRSQLDRPEDNIAVHVANQFEHEISQLKPKQERSKSKKKEPRASVTDTAATIAPAAQSGFVSSSMLIHQLRHPETLRMAIIAHEIMKRPWS